MTYFISLQTVQQIVASKKDEIRGQDRAIIVAYTISLIFYLLDRRKQSVDFEQIWKTQSLDEVFLQQIYKVIYYVNEYMLNQTSKNGMTVLSYSKTIRCWNDLQAVLLGANDFLSENFIESLLDKSEVQIQIKDSKKEQALELEIEMQKKLFGISKQKYEEMKNFGLDNKIINQNDASFIDVMIKSLSGRGAPSEKQIPNIAKIVIKLIDEGFEI